MPVDAIFWLLIIFVVIIAMFFGVSFLRRYFKSDDSTVGQEVFSLGSLRTMLKQGLVTQEEYDRLREQIIATVKKPTPKPPQAPGPSTPEPPLPR